MSDTDDIRIFNQDCIEGMGDLPDASVDMVLVDPPYGTTACSWDTIIPMDAMWDALKRICKPRAAMLFFSQCPFDKMLAVSNIEMLKYEWIWEKGKSTGFLNSRKMPHKCHENILVFYSKLPKYNPVMWKSTPKIQKAHKNKKNSPVYKCKFEERWEYHNLEGWRYPRDVLRFKSVHHGDHPTQKPTDLLEYLIRTYTDPGDTVLDFCMGSGSTGVAAANLSRGFIGYEIDREFFDISGRRIREAVRLKSIGDLITGTNPSYGDPHGMSIQESIQ